MANFTAAGFPAVFFAILDFPSPQNVSGHHLRAAVKFPFQIPLPMRERNFAAGSAGGFSLSATICDCRENHLDPPVVAAVCCRSCPRPVRSVTEQVHAAAVDAARYQDPLDR